MYMYILRNAHLVLFTILFDTLQLMIQIVFSVFAMMPGTAAGGVGAAIGCSKLTDNSAVAAGCSALGALAGSFFNAPLTIVAGPIAMVFGAVICIAISFVFGTAAMVMLIMSVKKLSVFEVGKIYGVGMIFELLPIFNMFFGHTLAMVRCLRADARAQEEQALDISTTNPRMSTT